MPDPASRVAVAPCGWVTLPGAGPARRYCEQDRAAAAKVSRNATGRSACCFTDAAMCHAVPRQPGRDSAKMRRPDPKALCKAGMAGPHPCSAYPASPIRVGIRCGCHGRIPYIVPDRSSVPGGCERKPHASVSLFSHCPGQIMFRGSAPKKRLCHRKPRKVPDRCLEHVFRGIDATCVKDAAPVQVIGYGCLLYGRRRGMRHWCPSPAKYPSPASGAGTGAGWPRSGGVPPVVAAVPAAIRMHALRDLAPIQGGHSLDRGLTLTSGKSRELERCANPCGSILSQPTKGWGASSAICWPHKPYRSQCPAYPAGANRIAG